MRTWHFVITEHDNGELTIRTSDGTETIVTRLNADIARGVCNDLEMVLKAIQNESGGEMARPTLPMKLFPKDVN